MQMRARGLVRAMRRASWRALRPASAVTVQVLTTTSSARSSVSRQPRRPRASRSTWVSYWFALHPKVTKRTRPAEVVPAGVVMDVS